jgi:hypothetical protein
MRSEPVLSVNEKSPVSSSDRLITHKRSETVPRVDIFVRGLVTPDGSLAHTHTFPKHTAFDFPVYTPFNTTNSRNKRSTSTISIYPVSEGQTVSRSVVRRFPTWHRSRTELSSTFLMTPNERPQSGAVVTRHKDI